MLMRRERFDGLAATAQRGFTLVELMVTLVVLAVLLALAAPNMVSFVNNSRLRASQGEFVSALMLARSEATRRGKAVTVQVLASRGVGAEFSGGWRVFEDANKNNQWDLGEEIRLYPALAASQRFGAARGGNPVETIVFNSRGFLASSERIDFSLCGQAGQRKGYQIKLEPVGLADVQEMLTCS